MNPVMLVILDGFGLAPQGPGNAVALAHTPNFDRYWQQYPHTTLAASGPAVGLPEGQMGNSEVGHLNIGAGRVVMQSLSFIQHALDSGEFAHNAAFNALLAESQDLHLMGLVSDGGVHSDIKHLFGLLELIAQTGKRCFVHVFTDGRDTPPDSALGFMQSLQTKIDDLRADIAIASVSGRYYAMDRDNRWERIALAYDAIVSAEASYQATSAVEAVQKAYDRGESDEFIMPTVITQDNQPITMFQDGDGVFFFNFRADRARQLSYALLGDETWQGFTRSHVPNIHYASLMQYDKQLQVPFALALPAISKPLAEVLAEAGLSQYHTAETEKYPHVTFFFNAQREAPFEGETRALIPSPQHVKTYDEQPQMSAPELTETTLARLRTEQDDFILINFANPDMVGHTGKLQAAITACEASDVGLGVLVDAVCDKGGCALIIADHGNAEKMLSSDGSPHTAHTTNPVPCVLVSHDDALKATELRQGGVLGDIAPTVLALLNTPQPAEMTGCSLIVQSD